MMNCGFKDSARAAAGSGNMGNYSRQVDNSLLASEAMANTQTAENALRAGAYDTDLNWKMNIANQADTNAANQKMFAQQGLFDMLGQADANTQYGLNSGQGMQNFAMGQANPFMAQQQFGWNNMNNWANILGSPIVLGSTHSKGGSFGMDGEVGMG